jgi:bifunctional isochorismate lyase/aryl carrier protein
MRRTTPTIPPIAPYPMPTGQAPAGPAGWWPDPKRAALLIHDMQRYFVGFFPPGQSPTVELLANIVRARETARAAGVPVIYSAQPGGMSRAERGLLHDVWGPGMTAGDADREIVPELAPGPGDLVVTKYRYSAFSGTGLAAALASLGRDQLIVCGVFAHLGCLLTAVDAFSQDIEAFLLTDAVADFSLQDHRLAVDYATRGCAVTMPTSRLFSAAPVPTRPAPPAT